MILCDRANPLHGIFGKDRHWQVQPARLTPVSAVTALSHSLEWDLIHSAAIRAFDLERSGRRFMAAGPLNPRRSI